MAVPQRTALTLPSREGIKHTLEQARWAEDEGYDDVWFADVNGVDALTTAAGVALATERVRIGTAIIPVYTRTPPVLASTAYVLNELSDGRFILGLGSSSQFMMENFNGVDFKKPLTRVVETTQLVKSMLNGDRTSFDGETVRSHGYRQPPLAPEAQPPVYMAALRSKMIEAAAEHSDGVILNLFPMDALPKMMEHVRIGAERAGKKLEDIEVVCRHQVIVTDDTESALNAARTHFAPYYATPVYNKFLAWAGHEEAANTIAEGWAAKDRAKTTGALDDDLLNSIVHVGSAGHCQDRIRQLGEMGITTHIISCVSIPDIDNTYAAFTGNQFAH